MATVDILNVLEETNRQMQKLEIGSRGPVLGEAYFGSPPCVRATYFGPPPCELYSDGTSRGNPGTAGIGFLLRNSNGEVTETFSSFLGYQFTNNAAKCKALIARLQHALDWGITAIKAYGGSELVRRQTGLLLPMSNMTTLDILTVFEEMNRRMQKLRISSRGPVIGATYFAPPCEIYFDGACRGNPSTAGIGFLLKNSSGQMIERFSSFLGYQFTNNAAEYKALIAGLQHALDQGITAIKVYGDSELVCRQVNGEYKINKEWLGRYYNTVRKLLGRFQSYEVAQVRREENFIADALANLGIDQRSVDTSPAAKHKVMLRCSTPLGAKHYVLEKRCEGVLQLQFILGTIKSALPKSYAAVRELCSAIKQEKAILPGCQDGSRLNTVCMPCLLAQY